MPVHGTVQSDRVRKGEKSYQPDKTVKTLPLIFSSSLIVKVAQAWTTVYSQMDRYAAPSLSPIPISLVLCVLQALKDFQRIFLLLSNSNPFVPV